MIIPVSLGQFNNKFLVAQGMETDIVSLCYLSERFYFFSMNGLFPSQTVIPEIKKAESRLSIFLFQAQDVFYQLSRVEIGECVSCDNLKMTRKGVL